MLLQVGVLNDAWFHGKQFNKHFFSPGGISYSPSSGIWQSVWIERLPPIAIGSVVGTSFSNLSGFVLNVTLEDFSRTNVFRADHDVVRAKLEPDQEFAGGKLPEVECVFAATSLSCALV
eukprot:SAG31_NODE_8900_length_1366_cov_1.458564_1_plen_118_part_10